MGTDGQHRDQRETSDGWVAVSRSATWLDQTRLGAWLGEYFIFTGRQLVIVAAIGVVCGLSLGVLL